MSEEVNAASTTSPSTNVATGDATGTSPATATVSATQGGDVGSAVSPGGSSSVPARTSESETPQFDGQINDLPDENANLAGSGGSSLYPWEGHVLVGHLVVCIRDVNPGLS
ncbi:hypothetical protein P3T76_015517 [Phytophthora citrophthora]|uniref:Uncharacterized protein n=1 Tax=Phytophthora citrophthora TaxID=4793 RepID=A0AAD9FZ76_9STRA|nr:hypothetical protein P3T76_015517 [Phytophthora citrophthora]